MKKYFIIILILSFQNSISQRANNDLLGSFSCIQKTNFKTFSFDANGKATQDFFKRKSNFFHRNDSLFIYPNKDIFIFKIIHEDTIQGVNLWVKDKVWVRNETVIKSNRKKKAIQQATLLGEFYDLEKRRKQNILSMLDKKLINSYAKLCDKNSTEACMYLLKREVKKQGGFHVLLRNKNKKGKEINTRLISLAEKSFALGNPDAYTYLGAYYIFLNKKEEGVKHLKKAMDTGSTKAMLTLIDLDLL